MRSSELMVVAELLDGLGWGGVRGNDFDRTEVIGAGLRHERSRADKSVKLRAFFESDRSRAVQLAAGGTVDAGGFRMDRAKKFHAGAFFHHQVAAANGEVDFRVCADDQVAGADHRAIDAAEEREIMAGETGGVEDAVFSNDHVAAGFDAAFPEAVDFVVEQAQVAAAFWALTGLGVARGGEMVSARETGELAWRCGRVE